MTCNQGPIEYLPRKNIISFVKCIGKYTELKINQAIIFLVSILYACRN